MSKYIASVKDLQTVEGLFWEILKVRRVSDNHELKENEVWVDGNTYDSLLRPVYSMMAPQNENREIEASVLRVNNMVTSSDPIQQTFTLSATLASDVGPVGTKLWYIAGYYEDSNCRKLTFLDTQESVQPDSERFVTLSKEVYEYLTPFKNEMGLGLIRVPKGTSSVEDPALIVITKAFSNSNDPALLLELSKAEVAKLIMDRLGIKAFQMLDFVISFAILHNRGFVITDDNREDAYLDIMRLVPKEDGSDAPLIQDTKKVLLRYLTSYDTVTKQILPMVDLYHKFEEESDLVDTVEEVQELRERFKTLFD